MPYIEPAKQICEFTEKKVPVHTLHATIYNY